MKNTIFKRTTLMGLVASSIAVSGCSTLQSATDGGSDMNDLETRTAELDKREAELNARAGASAGASMAGIDNELLPPNAVAGECYARVWVDAQYKTVTQEVVTREASQSVSIIPATYETGEETVLVSAASSRLETVPAQYGTESETIKVSDGMRAWKVGLGNGDAPASRALLDAATASGIDLAAAAPGMCFHEHYRPAQYTTESQQVLVRQASETVAIVPAKYEMVEETMLVKEASTQLVEVPAVYDTVEERIVDKPAHTIWKKGTGPIQRIDEATGEIMCLVEVPETYKVITRTVMKSPPTTKVIEIPAEYKTVSVRKETSSASEQRSAVPAEYDSVSKQVKTGDATFVWHEIHNMDEPTSTRTGNKICLTETEPTYKTVTRTVVTAPATTNRIDIPAEYKTVKVTKLASPASEQVTDIPAETGVVEKRELVKEGYMDWRSILCETNMTVTRISDIQRALAAAGYNPGPADGVIGSGTIRAFNEFQSANGLPVDKYLNVETIKALGVSPN